MISKVLFRLAKVHALGKLVGFFFEHFSALIPVRRVARTERVLAFYHPKPVWKNHVVLVPKKAVGSLLHLSAEGLLPYAPAIFLAARDVVSGLNFKEGGYTLCANGGPRQEVQQVHFHLFTGTYLVNKFEKDSAHELLRRGSEIAVVRPHRPDWEIHVAIIPTGRRLTLPSLGGESEALLKEVVSVLPSLDKEFNLAGRGYTLVVQDRGAEELAFHIIAGKAIRAVAG